MNINIFINNYFSMNNIKRIFKRTVYSKNEIVDCDSYYEICLYDRKNKEVARTKIDKEDLGKVKKYKWHLSKGYARTKSREVSILLHNLILDKKGVDHRNHNKLDNRKQNLRYCTQSQNCMNNKAKGYWWSKQAEKWRTSIMVDNKAIHIGYFMNEQDAINARRQAEKKYFKEFAYN